MNENTKDGLKVALEALLWVTLGFIMITASAFIFTLFTGGFNEILDPLPDDTILSIYMGNGTLNLKNGSTIELPVNLKDDFCNQSIREFEFALKERGITTHSQLCKYDSLVWKGGDNAL